MGYEETIKSSIVKLVNSTLFRRTAAIITCSYGAYYLVCCVLNYKDKRKRSKYPKDKVIVHNFSRGLRMPTPSPFALKLETWLRIAKIPYQNERGYSLSTKGLIPWITLNGVDVADSQFCIEYLSKHFNIDLNKNLSDEQKGISRAAMKLVEESLRWIYILHFTIYDRDPKQSGLPWIFIFLYSLKTRIRTKAQGYGRHTKEEVYSIGKSDLKAINDIIGNKKFLVGDQVSENDPSVFGMIAVLINHDRGPLNRFINENCPNILRYYETMRTTFWPDWNELIKEKPK